MRKIILLIFFITCFNGFAQDDEEKSSGKLCKEIDDKKAIKLYEKGINKKNTKSRKD